MLSSKPLFGLDVISLATAELKLHTAGRFGQAGNLTSPLGWSAGKQLINIFEGESSLLHHHPDWGSNPKVLVILPNVVHHLPVVVTHWVSSLSLGQVISYVLIPFVRLTFTSPIFFAVGTMNF